MLQLLTPFKYHKDEIKLNILQHVHSLRKKECQISYRTTVNIYVAVLITHVSNQTIWNCRCQMNDQLRIMTTMRETNQQPCSCFPRFPYLMTYRYGDIKNPFFSSNNVDVLLSYSRTIRLPSRQSFERHVSATSV